jgi:hypothetical protein
VPTTRLLATLTLAALVLTVRSGPAAEPLLPTDRALAEVIDHYIDAKLQSAGVTPAPQADDHTLVRRLYLDLAGRIPRADEARAYVASTDPDKRTKLIDHLLTTPEFVRHNASEFDELLRNSNPEAPSVRPYLLVAFRDQRPWDRMFRELLGVQPDPSHPEQFTAKRLKDPDSLTRDVSSVFFGLNISCAQCHKHPYISALTQDYYYGLKAFFARSYDFQGQLLERGYVAPLQFQAKGQTQTARLLFLNGAAVELPAESIADLNKAIQDENKQIQELNKNYARDKKLPQEPTFRPRAELVELALKPENRALFARALVNRLWYRFHGCGLVMRVDQMHALNKPSHPELLDWLTRAFIASEYDLRRLIRGLVSTRTYARASRWDREAPPAPDLFAVAAVRPLTPMQWGLSQRLASNPDALKGDQPREVRDKQLEALEEQVRKAFGKLIESPRDDLQIGINEALRLSNDPALLQLTGDRLVPALLRLKDPRQQIEEASWTVLSRPPTPREFELLGAYLEQRKDRPADALQQLLWALLNSPEFRFNH